MIHLNTEVHDSTTLEFKISYETHERLPKADFDLSLWLFIPEYLESNEHSFSRESFYENIKSRMRLISPRYKLDALTSSEALPYERLRKKIKQYAQVENRRTLRELKHDVCMVCNIARSGMRGAMTEAKENTDEQKCVTQTQALVQNCKSILSNYRSCRTAFPEGDNSGVALFKLGDEYICGLFLGNFYRLFLFFQEQKWQCPPELTQGVLELQEDMGKRGYPLPRQDDDVLNSKYLQRLSLLKKFAESGLYLATRVSKGGYLLEQLMFMFTAGLAMAFALMVNFSTRNFSDKYSLPLVLLMIISYMFKDRIKDWMRFWFHNKAGKAFFDRRAHLEMGDVSIGVSSQGVEYKLSTEIPDCIRQLRRDTNADKVNDFLKEDILVYRHGLRLNYKRISRLSHHPLLGVAEILRVNLSPLMRWMDNPTINVHSTDADGRIRQFPAQRTYCLDIVAQSSFLKQEEYTLYRVELNKTSILDVHEVRLK